MESRHVHDVRCCTAEEQAPGLRILCILYNVQILTLPSSNIILIVLFLLMQKVVWNWTSWESSQMLTNHLFVNVWLCFASFVCPACEWKWFAVVVCTLFFQACFYLYRAPPFVFWPTNNLHSSATSHLNSTFCSVSASNYLCRCPSGCM